MASLRSLDEDDGRYCRAFQLFLERSSEHQYMQDFIHCVLPDMLTSIGEGNGHLNVMGVGSGSGELDLDMCLVLKRKHPGLILDNEVVEPSVTQLNDHKALVSKTPNIDDIHFTFNQMTACEFEKHWTEKNMTKKMDFISMIHMMYYVKDPAATISFYHSLLNKNGKLLIILMSDESGWGKLTETYRSQLCSSEMNLEVTSGEIENILNTKGLHYQSYKLPCTVDVAECFIEGNENGELLVDFLTHTLNFSKRAPPELKAGVLELMHHPDCSVRSDGKVLFSNTVGVLIVDA